MHIFPCIINHGSVFGEKIESEKTEKVREKSLHRKELEEEQQQL